MIKPLGFCLLGAIAVLASCGQSKAETPKIVISVAEQPTVSLRCEFLLQSRLAGDQVTLVAAYESTATEISAWMERKDPGRRPRRCRPGTDAIAPA